MNETKNYYAFYRESTPSFLGERTYAGVSNGLERSFYGLGKEALEKCEKMMAGARKNNRAYQILRYEFRPGEIEARVHVMYSYGVLTGNRLRQHAQQSQPSA